MGGNGEECLAQNPHIYTAEVLIILEGCPQNSILFLYTRLEEVGGHTVLALSVRPSVCLSVRPSVLNPFPNKPWFLRVCSISLFKTMWEKEKLLVTSNFSFSQSVFYAFGHIPAIFIQLKVVACKLFQFG